MSTMTHELRLRSNAGYTVPDGYMGYRIESGSSDITIARALIEAAAKDVFKDLKIQENYKTGKRTITLLILPRSQKITTRAMKDTFIANLEKLLPKK